jgi:hypothetical protein
MPPSYWAEALAAATYLLNRRPCQPIEFRIPFTTNLQTTPTYVSSVASVIQTNPLQPLIN